MSQTVDSGPFDNSNPLRQGGHMTVRSLLYVCVLRLLASIATAQQDSAANCLDCHSKKTPNIVSDWKISKHSGVGVTCVVCHGDQHNSEADIAKVKIPTPD